MAIDNILCISNGKSPIVLTKFKSAQDYDTRGGWGYTKRITNYKGDKVGIDVNESGLREGDSCAKKRYLGSEVWEDKAGKKRNEKKRQEGGREGARGMIAAISM